MSKKIAVYLEPMDWRAVIRCLEFHISREPLGQDLKVLWFAGRDRIVEVIAQIEARIQDCDV